MGSEFKYAKLVLDEPRNIYYSGQVLNGYIECELSQPLDYTAITINYLGKATVFWTETEIEEYNGIRRNVEVKYGSEEEYFNISQCISGGIGIVKLQEGYHKLPFQYLIPSMAPSSYVGEKGKVQYMVTAYIDYPDPGRQRDVLSKEFEVVAPLDLNNADEHVQRPMDIIIEEFYSCCFSSSPLNMTLSLPAAGYCPGQKIPVHIKADNRTAVEVKGIVFQLVKEVSFHSREPKSEYTPPPEVLLKVKTSPILSKTRREFTVDIIVPDMIAPNLENCSIIDVSYLLKITVQVSGCNDDYEDEAELFIGLVPISTLVEDYTHPLQSDLPNAPIPQGVPEIPPSMIQNSAAYTNNSPYPNSNFGFPNTNFRPPNANFGPPNTNFGPPNTNFGPPNANVGSPNPITGHPNSSQTNYIPMIPLKTGNVGFVVPESTGVHPPPYPIGLTTVPNVYAPFTNINSPSAPPSSP